MWIIVEINNGAVERKSNNAMESKFILQTITSVVNLISSGYLTLFENL